MLLILEIAMLVMGIIALAKGKVTFSKTLVVRGAMARLIGIVFLLPLPLSFGAGFVLGFMMAAQGKNALDIRIYGIVLEVVIVLGCGILGVILGYIGREPAKKKFDFDDRADELLGPPRYEYDGPTEPGKETGIRTMPEDGLPR